MARVTAEDCLKKISNRFVLSNIAAKRTKQLLSGSPTQLTDVDNKPSVIALREIADSLVRPATEEEIAELEASQEEELESAVSESTPIFSDDNEDSSDSSKEAEQASA